MAKTIIDLPKEIEVVSVDFDKAKGTVTIEHRFLRGQTTTKVAHLICEGAGGKQRRSLLSLNGNLGTYTATPVDNVVQPAFDMDEEEYAKWQKTRKNAQAKEGEKPKDDKAK